MSNERKGKDLLIGAVVGGILGAATALLFAPKSGRELRSDIAEQAQVVSDKTVQIASTVSQRTQEVAKTVSTTTSELYGKAKDTAVNVVDTVRSWKESKSDEELISPEEEVSEAAEDLVILGNR
ncbi:YtxH domain-containing protein [Paenibacillus alginolyticus]|uniref:YtxH domain-containing protein n=1 Tax=Paenibacillus alginolyticus TaxID=59839 RepID=A0ABT4GKF7_9BACL|nr:MULTISPECIES: YtxH domain-containing protein [Paenibacillus]MCY9696692.1 YtxH domain-containing protein [Paenibacillus alginolyticus]MEC0144961.1 YtxH domain-containing protein [Paenibacillus alginolyticus]NRF90700.1 YtxH domain-containing protein [Paenibacillus frigoriresistens]